MFDAETTSFIQFAVPLEGLDLEKLPQQLTQAYASVVSARLGAVKIGTEEIPANWQSMIFELRRIAETYEGLTIFLPEDDNHRPSCAFVAGSAHFTLNQAERIQVKLLENQQSLPSLSPYSVAPEVAAALLFLIGGHQADAAETAKAFNKENTSPVCEQLLDFIAALASGNGQSLRQIANMPLVTVQRIDRDYLDVAADVIWQSLARAVQMIAKTVLGLAAENPIVVIHDVIQRLSSANQSLYIGNTTVRLQLQLAGPYHLAKLLSGATEALLNSAVTATNPPTGTDGATWSNLTSHLAAQRPFLWRNHIKAIDEGFLESGTSFVLTFPTGAGKTTITELRIATELIRGRTVVYLAPTRALVDQVANEISRTVRPIARDVVLGRFLEDFGELAEGKVFVQTPEQCLAYLTHDPDGHSNIGLIVVDECHQLCERPNADGSSRLPGRRAVDAMWALLSLLQRSPTSDIILISAMVRNGGELGQWLETITQRPARVLDLGWKPTRQVRGVVAYEDTQVSSLKAELKRRQLTKPGKKPGVADKRGITATPVGLFCHTQVWNTASTFAKFPLLPESVSLGVNNYWGLSANKNEIGGKLLGATALAGMRPIVFSQNIDWTSTIAEHGAAELEKVGIGPVMLQPNEEALFIAASIELGDTNLVERPVLQRVGLHHGLLLLPERLAMESAFRRNDGLLALVATPTVAQGINLPAEAVIIAGDDRWTADGSETLAVHELLNAAGRAGRAGHYAHGIVIDLPGKVFSVGRNSSGQITFPDGLEHVMKLFGSPDQCLDIVDPITQVIDRIATAGVDSDVGEYLVRKIGGVDDNTLRKLLGATLGNALRSERDQRLEAQALLLKTVAAEIDNAANTNQLDTEAWIELATQAGLSPVTLATLAASLPEVDAFDVWSFKNLLDYHIQLLLGYPGMLFGFVDPQSSDLSRIMPRRSQTINGQTVYIEDVRAWEQRWQNALQDVLPQWLSGQPLNVIGNFLHAHRGAKGHVKAIQLGRRFALQAAGGLGYGVSLVAQVFERKYSEKASPTLLSWLRLIAGCAREGFDDPDKLLLFWYLRRLAPGLYPRVRIHQIFNEIVIGQLPSWQDEPDIEARRRLIRNLMGEV
ncbi:DEAD/DEAH box helicase [Methylomonas sp. MK1]|uniref:DEAD/DEAH box helicase n=1 Tax=Methylomonas sp. MK1 TaxID=1131552 RepID=UPI0003628DFB|nr:DEAD/DEAH box helicase [Methylomonas sp. MK1]